jgi:hypothetical protein
MAKKISFTESLALEAAFTAARQAGWTSPMVEIRLGPIFLEHLGHRFRYRHQSPHPVFPDGEYTRRITIKFQYDGLVVVMLKGRVVELYPGTQTIDWSIVWAEAREWNLLDSHWGENGGPIPTNTVVQLGPYLELEKI